MGSELIVLYIPMAILTLGLLLFLTLRSRTRWLGISLLLVSIPIGIWAIPFGSSTLAQAAFFSTGFLAACIFATPVLYLVRWILRRFAGTAGP